MIPYTQQFPGVEVAIRTAGLARYVTFELSIEGLNVPANTHLSRSMSANLAGSLNDVVRKMTTPYLWIIDDDHQFDPWILLRLLAHDKPVVTALTCMTMPPFTPVIYREEQEHTDPKYGERWAPDYEQKAVDFLHRATAREVRTADEFAVLNEALAQLVRESNYVRRAKQYRPYQWRELDDKSGLMLVFACGMSGMLIRRDVFEALPDPWFELGRTNTEEIGEDVYFCEKLRASSFGIDAEDNGKSVRHAAYVDLDLVFGHTTPATVWPTRLEDGQWTQRLQWTNGTNVVLNRPDARPVQRVERAQVNRQMSKSTLIIDRSRELQKAGLSEAEAFQKAVEQIEAEVTV